MQNYFFFFTYTYFAAIYPYVHYLIDQCCREVYMYTSLHHWSIGFGTLVE